MFVFCDVFIVSPSSALELDMEEFDNDAKQKQKEESIINDIEESEPLSWLEWIYVVTVESLSTADLCTDIFILKQLIEDKHQWWTTFSLIFMICPYLVSYTAMGTMMKNKSNKLSLIVMTPFCLLYFLILDAVFMCYALISSFIFLITFANVNIGDFMEKHFFHRILGVSRMELLGYRRLRTLSQLLFETFPSIILQIRMLVVLGGNANDGKLKVSYQSLYYSIGFAVLHTIMEGMILYLDSKACRISLEQYAIICLNARLSWVPFANILSTYVCLCVLFYFVFCFVFFYNRHKRTLLDRNGRDLGEEKENNILDFENIVSNIFCLRYKLDFEFGIDSWQVLIKYISSMSSFSPNIIAENVLQRNQNKNKNKKKQKEEANDSDNSVEFGAIGFGTIETHSLIAPLLCESYDTANDSKKSKSKTKSKSKKKRIGKSNNSESNINNNILEMRLGKDCCKNIDLFDLYRLYEVSCNKLLLECGNIDWNRMIITTLRRYDNNENKMANVMYRIASSLAYMGDLNALESIINVFNANIETDSDSFNSQLSKIFKTTKNKLLSNARYNMLPLKRCYHKKIVFGINCNESKLIYSIICELLRPQLLGDSNNNDSDIGSGNILNRLQNGEHFYVAMVLLWYTQGTISNHHCFECKKSWIDHITKAFESSLTLSPNMGVNNEFNSKKEEMKIKIENLCERYLPVNISIEFEDTTIPNLEIPVNIATQLSHVLSKLFGEYLASKASIYSLITAAAANNTLNIEVEKIMGQLNSNICNFGFDESRLSSIKDFEVGLGQKVFDWCNEVNSIEENLMQEKGLFNENLIAMETFRKVLNVEIGIGSSGIFCLLLKELMRVVYLCLCVCIYIYICVLCSYYILHITSIMIGK